MINNTNGFQTGKKFKSLTAGNDLWWYGGGYIAWLSTADVIANIPTVKRSGTTVGVIESGKIVEYIWHPQDVSDSGLVLKYNIPQNTSALQTFNSLDEALLALGPDERFLYSKENIDGVSSPRGSSIGVTK